MQYGKFYIDSSLALFLGIFIFMGVVITQADLRGYDQKMVDAGMEQVVAKVNGKDQVIWKKVK